MKLVKVSENLYVHPQSVSVVFSENTDLDTTIIVVDGESYEVPSEGGIDLLVAKLENRCFFKDGYFRATCTTHSAHRVLEKDYCTASYLNERYSRLTGDDRV